MQARPARLVLALILAGCGPSSAPKPPVPTPPSSAKVEAPVDPFAIPPVPQRRLLIDGPIRRGPYVQAVGPAEATVCFETMEAVEGKVVCEGKTFTDAAGTRHAIALKDLKAGTRYAYTIKPGELKGSFKTAPAADGDVFFLAWGDSRTYYDRLAQIAELAAKDNPDFTVHSGDLVDEGSVEEDWDRFFEAARPLLSTGALWPTMGNHEHGAQLYLDLFILPEPKRWYTFVYGPAQFFVLDGNWDVRREARQVEWLRAELARSTARFRFVVTHHPLISCPDDALYERETSMYALFGKLVEEGKVIAVFQGHNHNYQRAVKNGVLYITTGGAGAPLYPVGELTRETLFAREVHHYVRIRLTGRTMTLEAVDWMGRVIDRDERQAP